MRRGAALVVLLCACRPAGGPPPEVSVLGATAVEQVADARIHTFDAPAAPRLRVVADAPDELTITWSNGETARVTAREARGGALLLSLARPSVEGRVTLQVARGGGIWRGELVLRGSASAAPAVVAIKALAERDRAAAERALASVPRDLWPWACVEWARKAPAPARPDAYVTCAEGAGARGFVSEAASRRIAAMFWAGQLRRFTRAAALSAEAGRAVAVAGDPRLVARLAYQRAGLAAELGEVRQALRELALAVESAESVGEDGEATLYRMQEAVNLSELGRHEEALGRLDVLARASTVSLSARDVATLGSNAGWIRARAYAARSDPELLARARRDLRGAHAQYVALEAPEDASNTLASLAWLESLAEDLPAAERALAEARAGARPGAFEAPFLDLLDGDLALRGRSLARAQAAYRRVLEGAALESPGLRNDYAWRAELGLASAALLARRTDDALGHLASARRVLAHNARRVGEGATRVRFLDDRRRSFVTAIDLLASRGERGAALRLADEGQALLLRSLENDRGLRLSRLSTTARARLEVAELGYAERTASRRPRAESRRWSPSRSRVGR